jgi:hypothetical protein
MAIFSLIIGSLGAAGFTGAVTIFGLSPLLSAGIIAVGKSVLWNAVAKALQPSAPREQVQALISQAAGPRIRGYGKYLLGGTRALWEATGGVLHQIVIFHHGEVSSIVSYDVDGETIALDGAGSATSGPAVGYLKINAIITGDGGNHAPALAAFPVLWTAAHKLTGLATYYIRMTAPPLSQMSKVYPRQAQTTISAVANLSKVLDPRTSITAFSELTGPCALDFLTHPDGYRIPLAQIDLPSFSAFTNVCDQDLALKAGGTEKRYRVGGYYSLEDAPKDTLTRILATADAQCYMTADGKAGVLGGSWLAPDVTIGADDILAISLSDGFDEFKTFNVLKGKFTSPAHRFQETECDEMVDSVALLTQAERVETMEVDMCPSAAQMRRLMKSFSERNGRVWRGTIKTNLVGMKARFPRGVTRHTINVVYPDMGINGEFEVVSHQYSVGEKTCVIGIESFTNPYGWNAATEEGNAPPPLAGLVAAPASTPVPSGLTLSQDVVPLSASQNAARLVALVSNPGRADLQLRAEYKKTADSVWQPMTSGIGDLRAYSAVVADGVSYQVRAAWLGYDVFGSTVPITAVSNPVAPAVPTSFASSLSAGIVTLTWINGDAGYFRTRVYRSATVDFNDASLIATVTGVALQSSSHTDSPGVGTWRYWVVTINASSVESAPVGPQTQTV